MGSGTQPGVTVDLVVDFHNEDETGFIWAWLAEAPRPALVEPGAVLVVGDDGDTAMAEVVDLVREDNGVIVHLRVLPGTVEDYRAALERAFAHTA